MVFELSLIRLTPNLRKFKAFFFAKYYYNIWPKINKKVEKKVTFINTENKPLSFLNMQFLRENLSTGPCNYVLRPKSDRHFFFDILNLWGQSKFFQKKSFSGPKIHTVKISIILKSKQIYEKFLTRILKNKVAGRNV